MIKLIIEVEEKNEHVEIRADAESSQVTEEERQTAYVLGQTIEKTVEILAQVTGREHEVIHEGEAEGGEGAADSQ